MKSDMKITIHASRLKLKALYKITLDFSAVLHSTTEAVITRNRGTRIPINTVPKRLCESENNTVKGNEEIVHWFISTQFQGVHKTLEYNHVFEHALKLSVLNINTLINN
jgi:hypothetical protein